MLLLAVQNLVLDIGQIVILHIFLEDLADVWILIFINELHPIGASDTVTFALGVGFVAKDGPLVEGAVESSNNSALSVSDNILLLLVDFVSNVALSSLDKDNFVDLIQFLEQDSSSILLSWLQVLEELEHEESIFLVAPVIVIMVPWVLEGNVIVLRNSEESLEDLAEVTKEEVSVNLVDDLHWELL
jgi:hypothetical protein